MTATPPAMERPAPIFHTFRGVLPFAIFAVKSSSCLIGCGHRPRWKISALARPRFLPFCTALPSRFLLLLIQLYQRTVSPLLPVVSLGTCGCRFTPSCSHYAAEAIRRHGAIAGVGLALSRLVKCTPRHPGGFDPVPAALPRQRQTPVCYATKQG